MTEAPPAGTLTQDVKALLRTHYRLQHGGFIQQCAERAGAIVVQSRQCPAPMWNHLAILGDAPLDHADELPSYLYRVDDPNAPAIPSGFEKFDRESWLVFQGPLPPANRPAGLVIKAVETAVELGDFKEVFYKSYQVTQPGYGKAIETQWVGRDNEVSHKHYIGYAAGKPVCGLTWSRSGSDIFIYNVATIPEARKKGYAAALLTALLAENLMGGASSVFLQVERDSAAEKLYRRLGFQELFTRTGYRKIRPLPGSEASETLRRQTALVPARLKAQLLAAHRDCSLETLLLGAWSCLLARYNREEDCRIALLVDGPPLRQSMLEINVNPAEAAFCWLRKLESARPEESAQHGAEAAFVLQKNPLATRPHFPLELHLASTGDSIELYSRNGRYSKDALSRMAAHLLTLLGGMADQPQASLAGLEILTPAERRQLLVDWNSRGPGLARGRVVSQLFEEQVERAPETASILLPRTHQDGENFLTYRQLNRRANKLAHYLRNLGVTPGTYVGLCLNRTFEYVIGLLAVWKIGAACVPLDPAYPRERIAFMLEETKAPVLLTHSNLAAELPEQALLVCLDADWPKIATESEKNLGGHPSGEQIAYVIYTSGSTGTPKGVLISHAALAEHCLDALKHYSLHSHDRVLQFSSFNFDASLEQIIPPLLAGACLFIRPDHVWSAREFCEVLAQTGLTVADLPTAYWHQLTRELVSNPGILGSHHLRLMIVGGEAMGLESVRLWQQSPLREARLINAYGPTETTITATTFDASNYEPGDLLGGKAPIGRPRGGRTFYILDLYGNPAPVGVPGEIYIGGECLAAGYLDRPELNAERFVSNPFSDDPGSTLYRTGDLGRYLEDGVIEFLGRLDDQVKIRGYRIELGEIENVLIQHPGVEAAVVLAREESGEDKRLVAYCVPRDPSVGIRDLRLHLKAKLPEYMNPSAIMLLKELPLTPSGKVDRKALPSPENAAVSETRVFKGPSEPLELRLQLVFERVLNRVNIPVDASFFELGGDSLQALELLVEIERTLGKNLPLGTLYQSSTVEALAQVIHQEDDGADFSCLVPLQTRGAKPPLYLIHTTPGDVLGYGNMIYHLGLDQPCYGFQSLALKEPGTGHDSIEEMAAYYTQILREVQPKGPYLLGGWCYGGMIALEMARLLQAQGEEVPLLALLETVAMAPRLRHWRYFAHRLNRSLRMSPARWALYFSEKVKYWRDSRMANRMRFKQVAAGGGTGAAAQDVRLAHLEEVYSRNLAALRRYRTEPYDGKVTLFNASEQDPALIPDPQYGWIGLSREIEIHPVPGNHDTMLAEPHVRVLAGKLKSCIEKVCPHP